ncbi:DUF7033 domain-containing protein [Luteibaculum oceani]|uniref:DUF7033 domain-containing protein n=1 Tax=Luteibaculum oceani TaxID=1294296 RepID=A0A5C6V9W7_9FLAO|nr:hypothetical protein [Luteibaculum oceani]TXC81524.1 hypothetical protein FRX97_05820 [Luteibaculum oceani]
METKTKFFWKNFWLRYRLVNGRREDVEGIIIEGACTETTVKFDFIKGWIESGAKTEEFLLQESGKLLCRKPIISWIFYILSGAQEIEVDEWDEYSRFPYEKSWQAKHSLNEIPVVDYLFQAVFQGLVISGVNLEDKFQKSSVFLSHDIDTIHGFTTEFKHLIKSQMFKPLFRLVKKYLQGYDAWNTIQSLMKIEQKFGFKSTFFFLAEHKFYKGVRNADYKLSDPYIQYCLRELNSKKFTVGLHGALNSFRAPEYLKTQLKQLNPPSTIHRFHFLHFQLNRMVLALREAGIKIDCSLGWASACGFRMGTAKPFYLFDHTAKETTEIIEIPFQIMDATLANAKYGNYSPSEAEEVTLGIISQIEKVNGVVGLIWHNNYFSDYSLRPWKTLYIKLLEHFKDKNIQCFDLKDLR